MCVCVPVDIEMYAFLMGLTVLFIECTVQWDPLKA